MTARAPAESADDRGAVKSANRVLDLFELLAGAERELSHAEIAGALTIPKSSLSQLLATLQARGYLKFSHERRQWRLGDQLMHLARAQSGTLDLATLALPILQKLTGACQESSALNVLDGDEAVVTAAVMGPMRLVSHMREGDRAPLYGTSGGKAILAALDVASRETYLASVRFRQITARTLRSVTALRRELGAVQRDGVAYSIEEFTSGIVGIAVPLAAPAMPLPAAINVAMPAVRYNAEAAERIRGLLLNAAAELMRRLSG